MWMSQSKHYEENLWHTLEHLQWHILDPCWSLQLTSNIGSPAALTECSSCTRVKSVSICKDNRKGSPSIAPSWWWSNVPNISTPPNGRALFRECLSMISISANCWALNWPHSSSKRTSIAKSKCKKIIFDNLSSFWCASLWEGKQIVLSIYNRQKLK